MYSAEIKNQANIAAAHSTPTAFAVARLRNRNRPSGINGERARDSINRNAASSAADSVSSPIDWIEVQPAWLPLTTAYTASISDSVTVKAPATSRRTPLAARVPRSEERRVGNDGG